MVVAGVWLSGFLWVGVIMVYFESDVNLPGGAYLIAAAALGVDVSYVLTGVRNPAVQAEKALAPGAQESIGRKRAA